MDNKLFYNDDNYIYMEEDFAKTFLDNVKLSWKDKGIILTLISREDLHNYFNEYDLVGISTEGIDSINRSLESLCKLNYISKIEGDLKGYRLFSCAKKLKSDKNIGFVYVITDSYKNYKIGMTNSLVGRFKSFETHIPYFSVIKIIRCLDMRKTEKELHNKFKSKNIKNEWFKLNEKDLEYINSLIDDDIFESEGE